MEVIGRVYPKLNLCKLIYVQIAMLKSIWQTEWELTTGCSTNLQNACIIEATFAFPG
jgi:hypothetical protein